MKLLLQAGTLISAVEGETARKNQAILIDNGLITAIDSWDAFSSLDSTQVIDAKQFSVLPGLIDAHTHITMTGDHDSPAQLQSISEAPTTTALRSVLHAERHLSMGVTTIRVLGSPHWADIALRDAIRAAWFPGPRMVCAGKGITSTGGHMDYRKHLGLDLQPDFLSASLIADDTTEARRAAWTNLMHGADVIKINATLSEYVRSRGGQCSPELTRAAMEAICEVAHATQRRVAAHCHGGVGVDWAIDSGVDTFEHGRFLTDSQLARMAALHRHLVPTLSPEARRVEAHDNSGSEGDLRWFQMATEAMYDTVARAHKHGVPIAAGSDVGMPYVQHGQVAYEAYQLTVSGLSNLAAIASTTRIAAEALNLGDSIGQLRSGYIADVIVVDGDPRQDLRVLQNEDAIKMVIQGGEVVIDRLGQ